MAQTTEDEPKNMIVHRVIRKVLDGMECISSDVGGKPVVFEFETGTRVGDLPKHQTFSLQDDEMKELRLTPHLLELINDVVTYTKKECEMCSGMGLPTGWEMSESNGTASYFNPYTAQSQLNQPAESCESCNGSGMRPTYFSSWKEIYPLVVRRARHAMNFYFSKNSTRMSDLYNPHFDSDKLSDLGVPFPRLMRET